MDRPNPGADAEVRDLRALVIVAGSSLPRCANGAPETPKEAKPKAGSPGPARKKKLVGRTADGSEAQKPISRFP